MIQVEGVLRQSLHPTRLTGVEVGLAQKLSDCAVVREEVKGSAKKKVTPFLESDDDCQHFFFRTSVGDGSRGRKFMTGVGDHMGGTIVKFLQEDCTSGDG